MLPIFSFHNVCHHTERNTVTCKLIEFLYPVALTLVWYVELAQVRLFHLFIAHLPFGRFNLLVDDWLLLHEFLVGGKMVVLLFL